jgi:hypothetical protein
VALEVPDGQSAAAVVGVGIIFIPVEEREIDIWKRVGEENGKSH